MRALRMGAGALAAICAGVWLAGCITVDVSSLRRQEFVEEVVLGERGPKILLLDVDGFISEQATRGALGVGRHESMVSLVREQLDLAREDDDIEALLLRINSGGGTATASDIVYREVLRFKQEQGVPVVAQVLGTAASGGYYVAMAADTVRAHPTSITGSIGVIFAGLSFAGLMDRLGIEDQTLTAGRYKDAGSPLRRMTPEERAYLGRILQDLRDQFVDVVAAGRPGLTREQVEELADGRIFSAPQALELGLVDEIGDLPSAVGATEQRAGLSESRVVVYRERGERRANIFASSPGSEPAMQTTLEPLAALGSVPRPAFLYLWWPGGS